MGKPIIVRGYNKDNKLVFKEQPLFYKSLKIAEEKNPEVDYWVIFTVGGNL